MHSRETLLVHSNVTAGLPCRMPNHAELQRDAARFRSPRRDSIKPDAGLAWTRPSGNRCVECHSGRYCDRSSVAAPGDDHQASRPFSRNAGFSTTK